MHQQEGCLENIERNKNPNSSSVAPRSSSRNWNTLAAKNGIVGFNKIVDIHQNFVHKRNPSSRYAFAGINKLAGTSELPVPRSSPVFLNSFRPWSIKIVLPCLGLSCLAWSRLSCLVLPCLVLGLSCLVVLFVLRLSYLILSCLV
jgi:hypothetical protein